MEVPGEGNLHSLDFTVEMLFLKQKETEGI